MDLLLVSARSLGPAPHPSAGFAAELGAALTRRGHRVRWLCPWPPDAAPPELPDEVEMRLVRTSPPPFRKVTARLCDLRSEEALVSMLREDPPELMHLLGHGGASSHLLAWTAERLGVATVISAVDSRALFCHRGDLRHAGTEACADWSDPRRCRDCSLSAAEDGLGPSQAILGQLLRVLGDLSPYPSAGDFESRADMIALGLSGADRLLLGDEASAITLRGWGVPERSFRIGAPEADDIEGWLSLYAGVSDCRD